ncbi:MAG: hypothetical protein HY268_01700 [Deltaproteobacteria bacterium]|nr:hypothetical protein [Deltaproteobacteria bacterium]
MSTDTLTPIEKAFSSLPLEARETIIRHGVALRVAELQKRLFLAESKVRHFEERYRTTLDQLEATGLPDDASYEMHEEYILCHHWTAVARKAVQEIASLQHLAQQGIQVGVRIDASD